MVKPTEVRQEAVQQALAALKNRPKPSLPMPSKRSSVLNRSPDRDHDDTGEKKKFMKIKFKIMLRDIFAFKLVYTILRCRVLQESSMEFTVSIDHNNHTNYIKKNYLLHVDI